MITHTLTRTWSATGRNIPKKTNYTQDMDIEIDELVGHNEEGPTTVQLSVGYQVAGLQVVYLVADGALTLKFNDTDTPVPQIDLVANVPYVWADDTYFTCPFAEDVTTLYVTNASTTTDVSLQVRVLGAALID